MSMTVSWFSAGVSSAVATKLAIDMIDRIFYTHIDDQHPDTLRFVRDCEVWFGKPVEILRSRYKTVREAVAGNGDCFIRGPHGAPCTRLLKQRVRQIWEGDHDGCKLFYMWGMDTTEQNRADSLRRAMPRQDHIFPLIERDLTKKAAHQILRASGIKRPAMYDLGYQNNNCIGCVRGGMGYFNKVRNDFPDVFAARATMEREVNATCLCVDGTPLFLDELDPERGKDEGPICDECGIFCELMAI